MKRASLSAATPLVLALAALVAQACQGTNFAVVGQGKRLFVNITQGDMGAPDRTLPVSPTQATPFTVSIEAELPDGTIDTSFNGYVNLSVQPGAVAGTQASNVQLQNGSITGVVVPVLAAFGPTHIWAEDLGFEPVAPDSVPPPQCADGIDNNHNGLIDYPADPGCYAPIDNTEDLGTYASGASETIYFALPRIQLVRGYDSASGGVGNVTAYPNTAVGIDTGWRGGTNYAFSTVVIGLSSAGFYVQDLENDENPAPGYGGIYAYNFETPTDLRVCDRLQVLSGTSADFYGYTELNYPAWQLEYWNPTIRPCLVPEPMLLGVADVANDGLLWQIESTLARIETAGTVTVQVAAHFGPENVPYTGTGTTAVYTPTADASNCDYNHDGKINYYDSSSTPSEANCAAVCSGTSSAAPTDYQCSEYSAFASENEFIFVVSDSSSNTKGRMQADGAAAASFDPLVTRGQTIRAFTGVVTYFSGGTQFTLNARCDDDVVTDLSSSPLTSNVACVSPRTSSALNTP